MRGKVLRWQRVLANHTLLYVAGLVVAATGSLAVTWIAWRAGEWWSAFLVFALLAGLVFFLVRNKERLLFITLVLSLSWRIDFRLFPAPPHTGGMPATVVVSLMDLLLAALLLIWAMEIGLGRQPMPRINRMDLLLAALILLSTVSILNALYPVLTAFELLRMVKGLLLFFYIRHHVRQERDLQDVVICLLIGVLAQGVLALAQQQRGGLLNLAVLGEAQEEEMVVLAGEQFFRSGGLFGSSNTLARYLELLLPLALTLFLARPGRLLTGWGIAAFALGSVAMILTFSRGGWVALGIGIVLVVLQNVRWQLRWRSRLAILGVLAVTLGLVYLLFGDLITARLFLSSPAATNSRLALLLDAWEMIKAHPLIGIGLNNFVERLPDFDVSGISSRWIAPVHNEFVLMAAETGFLGLIAFTAVMGAVVWRAWRTWRLGSGLQARLAGGLLAGFIAFFSHSLLGWAYRIDAIYQLFWFLAGFLWALPATMPHPMVLSPTNGGSTIAISEPV